MTPALIREAADMFDADTQCCSERLNGPGHATSCIVTRLRSAADQMEKPPEDDITGNMWIAGRAVFVTEADRFAKADRHEIASAIADRAPEKIYRAMITAVRKTEQEG